MKTTEILQAIRRCYFETSSSTPKGGTLLEYGENIDDNDNESSFGRTLHVNSQKKLTQSLYMNNQR